MVIPTSPDDPAGNDPVAPEPAANDSPGRAFLSGWRLLLVIALVLAAIWLAATIAGDSDTTGGAGGTFEAAASPFQAAVDDANLRPSQERFVTVGDGGATLIINGESDDSANPYMTGYVTDGVSVEASARILAALDMPDSVIARMSSTRALDGTQIGEWGDFTASWTYHPDDGLDIIVETR